MNRILSVCKLIRLPYLIAAAFIMIATRELILSPILGIVNHQVQMPEYLFIILVLSTLLLIAAAYIINDYFDTKFDRVTRKGATIVGREINRRSAIKLHSILNFLAIVGGLFVAYKVGYLKLGILFILASGLLWFYCTSYKRYVIFGKLIISLMIAAMPMIVLLFEIPLLSLKYADFIAKTGFGFLYFFDWVGGFAIMLFLSTFIMNLTKECKKQMILNEMPMSTTIKYTLIFSYVLLIVLTNFLAFEILEKSAVAQYYIIGLGLVLPVLSVANLLRGGELKDIKINYVISKVITVAVLGLTFIADYVITNKLL